MRKRNKNTFLKIKILITTIILFMLSGVGVMAVSTKVNNVTITLSDGYEMNVLTTKTNVSEILQENNILIKGDEKVTPSETQEITENKKIIISNKSEQEIEVAKVSESGVQTTLDELLGAYDTIVEKIEVEEEEIPYETIEKDISSGAEKTKNKVLREGKNGLKKVTYKVKYQNNTQIDKIKISEEIVEEPVDKIVQIKSAVVSSRASTTSRTSQSNSGSTVKIYKVTAYCSCAKCCGKTNGITSSGKKATAGRTIAAPASFALGTKVLINGKEYVVEDRGGAIRGNRIDVYMNSHSAAMSWGVKYLPVEIEN